ncbi:MAG: bifunctional phosphoglucose/phosphomannose isomerase [Candidatus Thorarchaeota archaeon]
MKELENIDTTDMKAMVASFPQMLRSGAPSDEILSKAERIRKEGIDGICLIGMGGSAIAGEIVKCLLADSAEEPILTIRDYVLPKTVDSRWVVVAVSYSGNTEETISGFKEAESRGSSTFVITTGGVLKDASDETRVHLMPAGFQPRAALPIIFAGVLPLVETLVNLKLTDLEKVSRNLELAATKWSSSNLKPGNLAMTLRNKIPVIIGWRHLIPVAYRAKCQFNENSKVFASSIQIPEMNHNEIEGTLSCKSHPISPVFLRSREEDERTRIGIESAAAIFEENGCHPKHLSLKFDSRIEETLGFIMYLDNVSVRLAEISGVDPVSVERIAQLKRKMGAREK